MKFSTLIFICLTLLIFGVVFIAFGKFLKINHNIDGKEPGDKALLIGLYLEFIGLMLSAYIFYRKPK